MNPTSLIQTLAPVLFTVEIALYAILGGLGLTGLVLFVWRWNAISAATGDADKWRTVLSQGLSKGGDLGHIHVTVEDERTLPGRVVKLGKDNIGLSPEALEKVYDVQESTERRHLETGVSFLGTVGANAPFLGLTGTVLGILIAFNKFAQAGGKGSTEVMVAIARALVATALGLMIAIPAVVAFNILKNRIKILLDRSREVRGLVVARSLNAAAKEV
ncbi:MAG: MotA/TolQ/ExbB proton channel family protein [Fibrobacterota bacterium]|nr:MotA/TolQ/ExbB proton channel family protein [Fibrobacterota bacterium]QQS07012.1 MAG: MotA/TolQ/ExbB proton channel family protein [Fibrobacterota bacterium]